MWWGHHGFHPFGWILFALLAAFLIFKIFAFWRCGWGYYGWHNGRFDAEAILKRRLASGEISEAEYQRMRDILDK